MLQCPLVVSPRKYRVADRLAIQGKDIVNPSVAIGYSCDILTVGNHRGNAGVIMLTCSAVLKPSLISHKESHNVYLTNQRHGTN